MVTFVVGAVVSSQPIHDFCGPRVSGFEGLYMAVLFAGRRMLFAGRRTEKRESEFREKCRLLRACCVVFFSRLGGCWWSLGVVVGGPLLFAGYAVAGVLTQLDPVYYFEA